MGVIPGESSSRGAEIEALREDTISIDHPRQAKEMEMSTTPRHEYPRPQFQREEWLCAVQTRTAVIERRDAEQWRRD